MVRSHWGPASVLHGGDTSKYRCQGGADKVCTWNIHYVEVFKEPFFLGMQGQIFHSLRILDFFLHPTFLGSSRGVTLNLGGYCLHFSWCCHFQFLWACAVAAMLPRTLQVMWWLHWDPRISHPFTSPSPPSRGSS